MKYLINITFNVFIDKEPHTVSHYCDSYTEDENELKLFDDQKELLSCFKKQYIVKYEIKNLQEEALEEKISKKRKKSN